MFQLDYETRTATTSFMTDISKDKADSNIDFIIFIMQIYVSENGLRKTLKMKIYGRRYR